MSKWLTYKLDDLGEILNSKRIPLNSRERGKKKGKYPYYGASGIVDYIDSFIFEGEHLLISEDGENLRSRQTPIAFKANGQFWVNNHAHIFRGHKEWINSFLTYYFSNSDISPYLTGAVQPKLNKDNLLRIPIKFQSEQIAKSITVILSSLDDKIELNLQMNETLEAIAQGIFKEWFVDFKFPGFDGKLVDGLPKGWRKGSVLEISNLLSGGTPKTDVADYWNGEVKWLSAKDITTNNGEFIVSTEKKISLDGLNNSSTKLLPKYTTVVSARGTVGNYCILAEEMAISQSNYGLKIKDSDCDFFLFLFIENMILLMKQYSYGTVFDTITTKTFKEIEVVLPSNNLIRQFENIIAPVFKKKLSLTKENQTLTELRDGLLPKLMSGKIKVTA